MVVACFGSIVAISACSSNEEPTTEMVARSKTAWPPCEGEWRGPVEPHVAAARLLLERQVVPLGSSSKAVIENLGTGKLGFGLEARIYRAVNGHWREQDSSGSTMASINLPPRSVSHCLEVPIGENWRPGRYRVTFEVSSSRPQEDLHDPRLWAFFRVTSARSPDADS
jgi:Bacterial Ig-like domain